MLGKILTLSTLAALIVLSFLMQSTSPSEAGPLTILLVFFLLYIIAVGVMSWVIYGASFIVMTLTASLKSNKPLHQLSMIHSYYYASILALAPIMLLAITSVTQIGIYEIGLVIAFVALAIFYVKKRLQ
ncbi:MAG TPA: hypothetical protein VGE34_04885 [Candidatus Saccharimonadales bacterium]